MKFKISLAKLTGAPGKSGWSQIHDFTPEDPEKLRIRGRLIAVIATPSFDGNLDAISQGREVLTRIHEEYFGNLEQGAFEALKSSIERVISEFEDSLGRVEVSAIVIVGDVVYSVATGGAQVSLIRNNMLAKILVSKNSETISASGYPKEKDILILGTSRFFEMFSLGKIKSTLEGGGLLKAQDVFASAVGSKSRNGMLSAAFIYFGKEDEAMRLTAKDKRTVGEKTISQRRFREKLRKVSVNLIDKILTKLPTKKIYVRRKINDLETAKEKKTYLSVGIMLVFVLIVSASFGIRQKKIKEAENLYKGRLEKAIHSYEEAESLSSINNERARELITESSQTIDILRTEGVKDKKLDDLAMKIEKARANILGEFEVNPQLFIDLSLLSSGFEVGKMVASSETLAVLNKDGSIVASISISNKKANIISGPSDLKDISEITVYTDRVFALAKDGIYELGSKTERVIEKDWNNGLIYAYAGNIYILDKEKNQIYRFPGTGKTFSSKQEWLVSGTKIDFSDAQNWVIDGNIWILYKDNTFSKLSQGSPQHFVPKGVYPPITKPDFIYTNEELKRVYVLEKDKKRVVVLEKNGEYVSQYISDKLGEADFIAVSEKDKEIIFSGTEGKLYSINLRD